MTTATTTYEIRRGLPTRRTYRGAPGIDQVAAWELGAALAARATVRIPRARGWVAFAADFASPGEPQRLGVLVEVRAVDRGTTEDACPTCPA